MRTRRLFLVMGVAVLLCAGLFVVLGTSEPEPEYGGKKLSAWVERLSTLGNHTAQERAAASDAISHIGRDAIPYLLKWIQHQPPSWSYDLCDLINSGLTKCNADWGLDYPGFDRAYGAVAAFGTLQAASQSAIPELKRILCHSPGERSADARFRAAAALGRLGSAGLTALVEALTSSDRSGRLRAGEELASLGTNATSAVPALLNVLTNNNWRIKVLATNALRKIDPKALERTGP